MKRVKKACLGMAVVLAASLVATPVLPAAAATYERLTPQHDESVPGQAAGRGDGPRPSTGKPFAAPAPVWPAAKTAEVALDTASAKATRAGDLPVLVSPAGNKAGTPADSKAPAKVRVEVLDRGTTEASGVDGLLLRVGGAEKGQVRLAVNYTEFRYAHGADWGSRLRLVSLPECALKTPGAAGCQAVPLASENNVATGEVTADVTAAGGLVALAAAPAGTSGDYSASPLQPSSTWSAGNNAGAFGWSYPMRVPPAINGPAPSVGLSYSSASVDGRMAASNNQPSVVGEGFEFSTGFVERRYKPCGKDGGNSPSGVGDLCWKTDNAVLSLNGSSTELIRAADGTWHGRTEDGSKITRHTSDTNGNGDDDGEHWVVTTTDGTQYWFGRNRLPGWADGRAETNSTWTVPVFGNQSGEPCHKANFAEAHCSQAWRWNLDYVVDTFGNTMSYWYAEEGNKYARNLSSSTLASYTRGGHLARIDYGTRSNTAYGTAPAQVVLTPGDRCLANCGTKNATNWPDTPWDQECTAAPCLVGSPTFWTTKRLAKVTTRVWGGTAYRDVESWTLTHSFPNPGDGTRAGLWLDRISHAGHVGTTTTVPDVSFVGTQLANRVDATDHSPAMNWWRIAHINTETGASVSVSYSPQDCVRGSRMPDPNALQNNTLRCYPVRWQPPGAANPIWDYFHKYLVTAVTETDLALPSDGRSPRVLTTYEYLGTPAWRYTDDDGLVEDANKTWSVWRGYSRVRVMKGEGAERTRTETGYFRGMHGDRLPSGTRAVELPAAGGAPKVNDEDEFAGMVREEIVYNGPSGGEVSAKVNVPWRSAATASRTIDGVSAHARYADVGKVFGRTTLDGGRDPRRTVAETTYDEYGMAVRQENLGDDAVTGDEQCVLTTYVRNTTAWLMEYPSRQQTFGTDCTRATQAGLTEADVIGDIHTSYDQKARGVAPTTGAVSQVEKLKAWPNTYVVTAKATHDAHGRVKDSWDVRGNKTTTSYTPATGGPVTATSTTNHLGWKTSHTLEPAWGTPTATVDANDKRTELAHDGLGRLTAVWLPGRTRSEPANQTHAYSVKANGPSVVSSARLTPSGGYVTTHTLYDGHLRPRQTQAPDGGTGRVLTDTFYDSAGRVVKSNTGYVADGAPATGLFLPLPDAQIPAQTRTGYDGAGRPHVSIFLAKGDEKWRTTTVHAGDRVDTQPPPGAFASSTFSDVHGRTTRLRQYKAGLGSAYDDTTYTYDRKGQLTDVVDPDGNTWRYGYDLFGNKTTVDDPDTGVTTMGYNDAGDLTTVTDARDETLAYVHDSLGRKTSVHDDTPTGAKRAEWTYDTVYKGQQGGTIRYAGTVAYRDEVTAMDDGYRPTSRTITIPAEETGLAGTYTYSYTYHVDGSPATTRFPAVGGLASERLVHGYDELARPSTLRTNVSSSGEDTFLVNGTSYTRFGELAVIGHRYDDGKILDTGRYYEEGTRRLSRILTTRETTPSLVADVNHTRDPAGNITKVSDAAAADTQCFQYDHLGRLRESWTPGSQDCAVAPSVPGLGGPAPYWHSFTYDDVGNRLTSAERTTTTTTSRTYTYPAPGADQPHALKSMTTTGTGAGTAQYTYDLAGNTETQPGTAGKQTLTWDAEGLLSAVAEVNAGTSSYLYDAGGNRLIRRDPGGRTLYLPGQELRYTTSGSGIRYYSHAGQLVAQRTTAGVTWLVGDHQGTAQVSVRATDQVVTTRRQTPFGGPRPVSQPAWPNDKGFVGGTKDNTGLTHLGAREYNPTTGRFISVDRLIDYNNPQQMNGYTYASSSPVTLSDPSGLVQIGDDHGLLREEPTSGGGTKIVDRRSRAQLLDQQETLNFPMGDGTKSTRSLPTRVAPPPPKPKPKPSFAPWPPQCTNYVEIDCGKQDSADLAPVPKPGNQPKPRCAEGDRDWSSTGACEAAWAEHDRRAAEAKKAADNDMCRQATDRMATPACKDVIAHCFLTFHCDYEVYVRSGPPKGDMANPQLFLGVNACAGVCIGLSITPEGVQSSLGYAGSAGFGVSLGESSVPASEQNPESLQVGAGFGVGLGYGWGTTKDGGTWTSTSVQFGVGWQVGGQTSKDVWVFDKNK